MQARVVRLFTLPAVLCSCLLPGIVSEAGQLEDEAGKLSPAEAEAIRETRKLKESSLEAAEQRLRQFLREKRSAAVLSELGAVLSEKGETEAASECFKQVVKIQPDFPGAYKNLGRSLFNGGRFKEAAEALEKGIESDGPDLQYCTLLGQAYLAAGKDFHAEQPLRWALMAKGDDWRLMLALSHALSGQERYKASERVILEALQVAPMEGKLWRSLANSRISGGDNSGAIEALEGMRRLDILEPKSLWTLGGLYFNEKLYTKAAQVYRLALEESDPPAQRLGRVSAAFFAVGELEKAKTFAEAALKEDAEDAEALRVLGEVALRDGKLEKAGKAFKRASKADPLSGRALMALGDIAARREDYTEALGYYQSARALSDTEEAALRAQADLLLQNNRLKEALKPVKVLQREYPSATWDRLAREISLRTP